MSRISVRLGMGAVLLASAMCVDSRSARAEAPTTAPAAVAGAAPAILAGATTQAADGGELIRSKAQMTGYGAEAYRLVSANDEIVSVLKNGLVVICKRVPSPVVSVRGYCHTGGVYEGKWEGGGLSHLLEHLVAGGSSERRTEGENKELLQKIGNDSNAYTSEDHTAFFVNTTTPHMEQAVDLVTGWMLGAKITVPEYRREYQVVQRELERGKGMPDSVFWELASRNRYHVSPARVPVIGYQEVIQGLSRDDVYSYYKMAYVPNNLIFSIAGDMDPEQMLSAVRKYVSDTPPGRFFSHDITPEPPVLAPRTLVATFPRLGQARMMLAFPSVRSTDSDMYALDLLATVLGEGESSIFVENIRDQQHLATGIECEDYTPEYVDGSFMVNMQLDAENIDAATKAVLGEIEKVKTQGVDEDRLKRAKAEIKIARLKSMQTSQEVAGSLATDYLQTGDPHFSDRYVGRVAEVSSQQVQEVARKYLDKGKLITTVLLPQEAVGTEGLPKAEDLLRQSAPTTQESPSGQVASETQRIELDNGAVLLLKRITTTPMISINMYSLGGLTAEDAKTNGLGNMTMSLDRRGTTSRDANQISEFFDSTGGNLKTGCGNNSWFWTVECTKDDFAKTMDVYGDVVNHPSFSEGELKGLKPRIEAAIASQDAEWHAATFRFFKKEFYGPKDSPYQYPVIGTKENVAGFTRDQVKQWYDDHVLKAPRVIAIFGDINPDEAKALAQKYFGGGAKLPPTAGKAHFEPVPPADKDKPFINVTRVEVQKADQALAGVAIGFESDSVIGDPADYPLAMADTLTSGYSYPTGYIFETLRGLGLVYEADAVNSPGRDPKLPGTFLAYAGCDPKNVDQVVNLILLNIARLQGNEQDIQVSWFNRSKDLVTTADALEHETPEAQASQAALDELYGLGYDDHSKFASRINAVTLGDVQTIARDRLRNCVVTISTPDPEKVTIKPGRREYESFPPVDLTPRGVQHDVGGAK